MVFQMKVRNPAGQILKRAITVLPLPHPHSFFIICLFWGFFFVIVFEAGSLYSPGFPGIHCVDQDGLELRA